MRVTMIELSDEEKATRSTDQKAAEKAVDEKEKARKKKEDAIYKAAVADSVQIRNPKNGYIMTVSSGTADNLLRKNKGYRRVSNPPPVDLNSLKEAKIEY